MTLPFQSNDEKFSSHVIVHMPGGALFPSNLSLKPLVHYICRRMIEKQVGLVQRSSEEGDKALLCDIAVYTRNRNFRLHRSSKCGKRTELKVSHLCRFYGMFSTGIMDCVDELMERVNYRWERVQQREHLP